jgi:hypothetical protein
MILKRLLLVFLFFCLFKTAFSQNLDSITGQKPCRVEKKDTVIRFVRFRETGYTCDGKLQSAGNSNKRGQKDGPWLYYTPSGNIACWGIYRKNKKTGWWHGPGMACKIKYRKDQVRKQTCP